MKEYTTPNEYLELNAKLQKKKSNIRKALREKGILRREGTNSFDRYKYFTEAQYKELFTGLLADNELELSFTEIEYTMFEGVGKTPSGRLAKLKFILTDTATGFAEEAEITGEGMDKGDKAGYKAYTGALKYYLANTFMVATGDDPEREPEEKPGGKEKPKGKEEQDPISAELEQEATPIERKTFMDLCTLKQVDATEMLKKVGWRGGKMTKAQYAAACKLLG